MKDTLLLNQREDDPQARASLATVGSEGSRRENLEHSASEPKLVRQVGNPAKSGKAQTSGDIREIEKRLRFAIEGGTIICFLV
ncbi:MAG: hypothetical protein H0Z35_06625 [Thermoanaerobacteraceae bacterium]|nr:hypothetical protein [Thermoanaerobacteraceae bacterium]